MAKTGPKPKYLVCTVENCAGKPIAFGMCGKHYARMKRRGTTSIPARDRGTGTITQFGYIAIAKDGKKKQEHVLIVESVLGRELPAGVEVHHFNETRSDNRHENLVVCQDRAYHKLLHVRADALDACGNANYRKCPFCKNYSDPSEMIHNKSSRYFYHSSCKSAYRKLNREASNDTSRSNKQA